MSVADWVNLICAVLSLCVTIIIGILQIMQSSRINKLELHQADIEKKRYEESVEIEACRFISKHARHIGLLPLCAIAFAYSKSRPYSREMYSEFRLLSRDVRLKIFEHCGWSMCDVETDDFFNDCMRCLQKAFEIFLPKDNFYSMFYDGGKYVERAISYYGEKMIPHLEFEYDKDMTDILVIPFYNDNWRKYDSSVIDKVKARFDFENCSEIEVCQIVCSVARRISTNSGGHLDSGHNEFVDYGSPGFWSYERIETMEDLFLVTLFDVWSNLWILKEGSVLMKNVEN